MNRIAVCLIGLALAFGGGKAYSDEPADDEGLALRKSPAIQLFMGTCVAGRGQEPAVASLAKELGFKRASKGTAKQYLQQQGGRAWYKQGKEASFGVAVLENGLCSLFIHQGNPEQLQASMESWLPPKESGFTFEKEVASRSGSLSTTAYRIFRGQSLLEQWVLTVSSQPDAGLRAIMSYNAPNS